ncbi:MAG: hypothetical protein IJD63_03270 [Oscillospiraceae bacterium]|nr:hypothetical protein [Oscillospiraceae bacterium]
MNDEIIILRKKSINIKTSIVMLFATLLIIFVVLEHFLNFLPSLTFPPLIAILGILLIPICLFCFISYLRDISNSAPVLIINSSGIDEYVSENSVGLIKWEDIECINLIPTSQAYLNPQANENYFICIVLKQPEMYIKNQKLLAKLLKQKNTKQWGHIRFSTLHFKDDFERVTRNIERYHPINRQFKPL